MQGKVKWFSEEKGYGYIVADDGKEHYFNIRDIQGANLPRGEIMGSGLVFCISSSCYVIKQHGTAIKN